MSGCGVFFKNFALVPLRMSTASAGVQNMRKSKMHHERGAIHGNTTSQSALIRHEITTILQIWAKRTGEFNRF